jgi:hypothetical protein
MLTPTNRNKLQAPSYCTLQIIHHSKQSSPYSYKFSSRTLSVKIGIQVYLSILKKRDQWDLWNTMYRFINTVKATCHWLGKHVKLRSQHFTFKITEKHIDIAIIHICHRVVCTFVVMKDLLIYLQCSSIVRLSIVWETQCF